MGKDAGFSLVESLVVILIVSIATASFYFFNNASSTGAKLSSFTMEVTATLRATRSDAIAGNQQVSLIFDTKNRKYYRSTKTTARPIPEIFEISVTAARLRNSINGTSSILFFGDGSSSGGTIEISAGNNKNTIEISWLTGGISLLELQ